MSTNLDYALAYLARGWSIIPMAPRSKKPLLKWQEYQHQRPTEDEVRTWWRVWPDAGIAIITGAVSGLVVIDVDPRHGGDVQSVAIKTPSRFVVSTGGGGMHFYCAHPGGHVGCGKIEPGVDRQADGGYVIAPPSIHPDGMPYVALEDGEIAPVPPWALETMRSQSSADAEPWIASTLAAPQGVLPGTQEDTLTRLCWWAAKHLPRDIALGLLTGWCAGLPLSKPHDPWTSAHVEERLDRAVQKRLTEADPGAVAGIVEGSSTANLVEELQKKLCSARDFSALQTERDDWIVKDFIAPGSYTEIIGVMKEGKSTLVCALINALLHGEQFLGRECRPTPVLYVTEQVGISFKATLERGDLADRDDLYVLTSGDLFGVDWQEGAAAVVEIAKILGCGVIVIDTLARLANVEEEDEASSVHCLDPFGAARAAGIGVVFVRHGRKSGGAINVAARGSGAITGEMDICVRISAPKGVTTNYRHVEIVSRLTDCQELHLDYEDGFFSIGEPPSAKKQRASTAGQILELLAAQTPKALTAAEIVQSTGRRERTVRGRLTEMLNEGKIEHPEGDESRYRLSPKGVKLVDDLAKPKPQPTQEDE